MATPNNEKPIIVAFTLDFETGGLDCQDCACTQIAIHAVRIDTFETIDRYVKYISPYNKQPDKGVPMACMNMKNYFITKGMSRMIRKISKPSYIAFLYLKSVHKVCPMKLAVRQIIYASIQRSR